MNKNNTSRLLRMIRNGRIAFLDKERKSLQRILKEFLIASWTSRSIATYYFTSFLYKNNITNYLDYISNKECEYMQRALCDSVTYVILGDKLYFHKHFENFKIPMPQLLAYSIREKIVVKTTNGWTAQEITTPESLNNIINVLLAKSSNNTIFIKPTIGSGGKGIIKVDNQKNKFTGEKAVSFFKDFLLGAYIFQDEVAQHIELAKLNPSTLNTIRIDTFKAFGQKPEVISAFIRIGQDDSYVDNITAGGFYVGINIKTGRLNNFGIIELFLGGQFITHHPTNGIKFEGFPIPYFEEVKALAIAAANCLPQSLVGWDIAVSENGPVLIEGNTVYYAMSCSDMAYGGYRKNPVYNKVTDYVKKNIKKQ